MRKILFLAANPKDTSRLRLDEEVREISAGLKRAKNREYFKLLQEWAVRPRDIRRALLDEEPQIIHFSGHGAGEKGLIFEDDTGTMKFISGEALAGLFELFAEQIECVLLNGCYSQVQAEAISKYIPYVIGMQQEIGDLASIAFAVGFYDALGAGRSIEDAYKYGCNAIHLEGFTSKSTPIIFYRRGTNEHGLSSNEHDLSSVDQALINTAKSLVSADELLIWMEVQSTKIHQHSTLESILGLG